MYPSYKTSYQINCGVSYSNVRFISDKMLFIRCIRYLGLVDYQSIRSSDRLAGDQPLSSDGLPVSPSVDPLAVRLSELCSAVPGLVPSQLALCHQNPYALLAISEGARRGIIECQEQFRHERWNCTLEGGINVFDMTLQRGKFQTLRGRFVVLLMFFYLTQLKYSFLIN